MVKTFDINFNFGNAVGDLNKINQLSSNLQSNLQSTTDVFSGVKSKINEAASGQEQLNVMFNRGSAAAGNINFGLDEVKNNIDDLTDKQADFEKLISGPAGGLSNLVRQIPIIGQFLAPLFRNPLDNINRLNKSFQSFNDSFNRLGIEGFKNKINSTFASFAENTNAFTGNLIRTTSVAGKSIIANIGGAFSAILPSIVALLTALGPITLVIAGIVAVVFTLKKIWELNIGGIQKSVFGLVGAIRDNLGKAVIQFQLLLQKLSPLFKIVFTPIFTTLSGLVNVIGSAVRAIFTILEPIFDVFEELFMPFSELQGEGNALKTLFTTLGKIIEIVAKVIAVSLRVALTPITLVAKSIAFLISLGQKMFSAFKGLPFVQKIFEGIGNAVMFVKNLIEALIQPFKAITSTAEKIGKFLGLGGGETATPAEARPLNRPIAQTSVSTSTQNISQPNITVNTSREITQQGATDFANTLSGILTIQAKGS